MLKVSNEEVSYCYFWTRLANELIVAIVDFEHQHQPSWHLLVQIQ